jgi:hypothetical protein
MQNKYVGDIGDYGKYALLNLLCARELKCFVIWYLSEAIRRTQMENLESILTEANLGKLSRGFLML